MEELSFDDVVKAFESEGFTVENKLQKWMGVVPNWPWIFFQKEQGTSDEHSPEGARRYQRVDLICHPDWDAIQALEKLFGPVSDRRTDNLTVYPRKPNKNGELKPYGKLFSFEASRVPEFAREVRKLLSHSKPDTAVATPILNTTTEGMAAMGEGGPLLADSDDALCEEMGYESDAEIRKLLEQYAVSRAVEYYESKGNRVEKKGKPYDLDCFSSKGEHFRVEVKGTRSDGRAVLVTRNEVKHARAGSPRVELFVLSKISLDGAVSAHLPSGGKLQIIQKWVPEEQHLEPIQFKYRVPAS